MESTWGLAIFMWITIITSIVAILVYELRKTPEQKKYESEIAQDCMEKGKLSGKIVEVTPLGFCGTHFKRGGFGGALLGGFIGGVPGAVIGAALRSGKGVPLVRFAVRYGNGKVEIRECAHGSCEYRTFMKYVNNDVGK